MTHHRLHRALRLWRDGFERLRGREADWADMPEDVRRMDSAHRNLTHLLRELGE